MAMGGGGCSSQHRACDWGPAAPLAPLYMLDSCVVRASTVRDCRSMVRMLLNTSTLDMSRDRAWSSDGGGERGGGRGEQGCLWAGAGRGSQGRLGVRVWRWEWQTRRCL
jgi:hypothetical protein